MELFMISKKRDVNAKLELKDEKYILKKGSKVSSKISESFRSCKKVKKRRENNINKDFILLNDIVFRSSSTAGEFVLGTSCNGKIKWKNIEGKTLKEIQNTMEV